MPSDGNIIIIAHTRQIILKSCKESNAIKSYGKNAYVVFFQNFDIRPTTVIQRHRYKKIENYCQKKIF
jgi:hypothetical protein